MNMKKYSLRWIVIAVTMVGVSTASACTALHLEAKDKGIVVGRTMEFGLDVKSDAVVVPAGSELSSSLPKKVNGIKYKTKYGMVGLNFLGKHMLVDGMNEKGLYVGALYLPGYSSYPKIEAKTASKSMAPEDYVAWLLGNFSTIKEIKKNYNRIILVQNPQKEIGGQSFPGHFLITDKSGASVVIEPLNKKLKIYDNSLGVLTNSPTFDWHVINLSNYVNLSATNVSKIDLKGKQIKSFGQGSGLVGLPGDYTPPSRFVRAVAFSQSAITLPTSKETVAQMFHVMNAFDIPLGAIQEKVGDKIHYDFTQWTSVSDLKNITYSVKTYQDQSIRQIEVKKALKAAKGKIRVIKLHSNQKIDNISTNF